MVSIERQKLVVRLLLSLLVFLQVTLVATVYPISAVEGFLKYPKIYLSHAFGQDPTRSIASFILPITAFLIALIVSHRLYCLRPLIKTGANRCLWNTLVFSTAVCVVGLLGVAAVSVTVLQPLHWIAAALFFTADICLMIFFSAIDDSMQLKLPSWLRSLRISICAAAVISGVLFALSAKVSPLASGIGEILVSMLAIAYLCTFAHSSSFPIESLKAARSPRAPIHANV